MNRQQCLEIISENNQRSQLYQFVIFYKSPVTDQVEHRIIYSPQFAEGIGWLTDTLKFYKERSIPFAAYSCGGIYDSEGVLFPY